MAERICSLIKANKKKEMSACIQPNKEDKVENLEVESYLFFKITGTQRLCSS